MRRFRCQDSVRPSVFSLVETYSHDVQKNGNQETNISLPQGCLEASDVAVSARVSLENSPISAGRFSFEPYVFRERTILAMDANHLFELLTRLRPWWQKAPRCSTAMECHENEARWN